MKKLTYTVLTILATYFSHTSHAQVRAHIGLTSAVNASFVLDEGLSKDPRYNSQMTYKFSPVGLSLGVDLSPSFGLNLETIYAQQGQIYQVIGQVNNIARQVGERKITADYLQLPLLMNFMSSGTSRTRFNFMLGPQVSFLTNGVETYQQTQSATFTLPMGAEVPSYADPNSFNPQNDTYTVSTTQQQTLANSSGNQVDQFKKMNFGLVGALGLTIDLTRFIYLSSQVRANYNITDMRNEDFIDQVRNGQTSDIFGRRANMLVGVQLGLHVMFGGTRSQSRLQID